MVDFKEQNEEARKEMAILTAPNYAPAVRWAFENLIEKNQNRPTGQHGKPYIVTDWDNTAIIFDSQQSLFLYQAENLCYRLTPEHLAEVIAMELTAAQKAETEELRRDIAGFYRELYSRCEGLGGSEPLAAVQKSPAHVAFVQAMACLYKYPFGYVAECCRIVYLFAGYSLAEVKRLTEESIAREQQIRPERRVYRYTADGQALEAVYYVGLRFVPEQAEFFHKCMENGIDVYVCSASHEAVVQVHAAHYGISPENVLALKIDVDDSEKIMTRVKAGVPMPIKEGKAEAIRRCLLPKHGREPLLVMGDSMGDVAMLTAFSAQGLATNTQHLPSVLVAWREAGRKLEELLIQGRDEIRGEFRDSSESVFLPSV